MFEKFDIKFIIFMIAAGIIVAYGSFKVFEVYQGLGALIYFLGSLYTCFIYGTRWFGDNTDVPTSWPPIINTCPDFLTYYQRNNNGTKQDTCIDTVGVANPSVLAPWPKDGSAPTDSKYYFPFVKNKKSDNAELCAKAMTAGLTWEGITNGESCITANGTPGSSGSDAKKC